MKRLFIIGWSAVVVVVVGLMVLLYVSLLPHFGQIGNIMFVVLCIFLGYGVILGGVKTYSWAGIMLSERIHAKNQERFIAAGDVSLYLLPDNSVYHASKEHNMGLIAPPPSVVVEAEVTTSDEEILLLWNKGMSLRDIEKLTGVKYHRIQKVTSEAKDKFQRLNS
jgi:hypothetical protein